MRIQKRKKVLGIIIFALGLGIILAIIVPAIGWVFLSAVCLVCVGIYLLRC
jgi:hypothetical protein